MSDSYSLPSRKGVVISCMHESNVVAQYLIHLPSSGSTVTVDPRPRPALFRAFTCS